MKQRLCLLPIVLGAALAFIPMCPAQDLPSHLRLVCRFDEGMHGCNGAVNPFAAAGNVEIVKTGNGGAAKFQGHDPTPEGERRPWEKSAMIFDGVNIPPEAGTVAFKVRWTGQRHWSDGQRTWLAVLVPHVASGSKKLGEEGTGLAVFKDKDNSLVLAVYPFHDDRLTRYFTSRKSGLEVAEPDAVPIRISVGDLPRDGWTSVRMSWDREAGRVWLGVGEKIESAQVKFRKGKFLCLLIGTPPKISYCAARGFDGEIDDLVVDARTPKQFARAGLDLPADLPPMARPQTEPEKATRLTKDPWQAKLESTLRTHARRVLEAQKCGGWSYSVAFPSLMRFLSSKVVIPYTHDYVACSKAQNSAGAAVRVLGVYEALGDEKYLKAAEKTGRLFLALQQPAGNWIYGARVDPETLKPKWLYRPDLAPFEDHVQSHPVLLMWRLYDLTGREEYKRAAERGTEFILTGQNPNGSWSHHYTLKLKCGQAARGHKNAGEINDYTTSDPMMIMLVAYRKTGDAKYLASYLRGADWLVSAFIDKAAKGWAQQYDENNVPIQARHFEPAAVSLSEGISSVPRMLTLAYQLTGDRRYVEPLFKWKKWMLANKIITNKEKNTGGWHAYYDVETGKPIRMARRKVFPADPRDVRDGGFSGVLKRLDQIDKPVKEYVPGPETTRAALDAGRNYMNYFIEHIDPEAGTWVFDQGPTGKSFSPQTVRVLFLSWAVYAARQLDGQIPWDHRMSSLTMSDWVNLFCHVIPPKEWHKPFIKEEVDKARGMMDRTK